MNWIWVRLACTMVVALTACGPRVSTQTSASPSVPASMLPSQEVVAMGLLSPSDGWVLVPHGLLWTTDRGQHWRNISPARETIADAFFLKSSIGWAATWTPDHAIRIYRTSDTGASWRASDLVPTEADPQMGGYMSMSFVDQDHGWLKVSWGNTAFFHGAVYRTIDGGATWRFAARTVGGSIHFTDLMTGWSVYQTLFVTRDAGQSWQGVQLPGEVRQPPIFLDSATGVVTTIRAVGDGSSLDFWVSHDGGRSWSPSGGVPAAWGNADTAAILSPTSWIASVALDSKRLRLSATVDSGRTWSRLGTIDQVIEEFTFAGERVGWGRTSYGTCSGFKTGCVYHRDLLATSDGGRTWSRVNIPVLSPPAPAG